MGSGYFFYPRRIKTQFFILETGFGEDLFEMGVFDVGVGGFDVTSGVEVVAEEFTLFGIESFGGDNRLILEDLLGHAVLFVTLNNAGHHSVS